MLHRAGDAEPVVDPQVDGAGAGLRIRHVLEVEVFEEVAQLDAMGALAPECVEFGADDGRGSITRARW